MPPRPPVRDPRFDGEFFLGVVTTGIYCRPVCPARTPREENVRYYRSAAEAAQAGFQALPALPAGIGALSPAWLGTDTTVRRALDLIHAGFLNGHSLTELADRLGIGERYLRKLFDQKLGVSPNAVAQTQRLHFAQKLILETDLSMTEVAFAAGYSSLRRFNSATRENFGCAASELRRRKQPQPPGPGIYLEAVGATCPMPRLPCWRCSRDTPWQDWSLSRTAAGIAPCAPSAAQRGESATRGR